MFLFVFLFVGSVFTNASVSICQTNNLFVYIDAKQEVEILLMFANYGTRGASL